MTKSCSDGTKRMGFAAFLLIAALLIVPALAAPAIPGTIDPATIPKFVNQLVIPPEYAPDTPGGTSYTVQMSEFNQTILPPNVPGTTCGTNPCLTKVWGYQGNVTVNGTTVSNFQHSPSATFNVTKGTPITVTWVNNITTPHMFAVDPTLHWADPNMICMEPTPGTCMSMDTRINCTFDTFAGMCMPSLNCTGGVCPTVPFPPGFGLAQTNVSLATHLHGGEVESTFDGNPEAWWTANGLTGMKYTTNVYQYPNSQLPATLWYHDHALGITRINVMSGLAGFYLLRDPTNTTEQALHNWTGTPFEVPLAIQDRTFNVDGSIYFPNVGLNPTIHPYWNPEFFGNTIMVNGRLWPNLNVTNGTYRLRLLDGSNARFYTLSFSNKMQFTQIGSDGGFLQAPVNLTSLTIAPGERADILVDFSKVPIGTTVVLRNTAKAPFPAGAPTDAHVGQIMQFTVQAPSATNPAAPAYPVLPVPLNPTIPPGAWPVLAPGATTPRVLTLQEVMGPAGPVMILLDGQKYGNPVSELPKLGTTEEWVIVNPTADTHPIHLHLVQFQLVSRQPFQVTKYQKAWMAANGMPPLNHTTVPVPPAPYLQKAPVPAAANEMGWKDTVQMNPGEVTTIRVRFAPQTTGQVFPFDATAGPGYVWHCHIIDHEDNEMMRPYKVTP